jgi:hypothetical protein
MVYAAAVQETDQDATLPSATNWKPPSPLIGLRLPAQPVGRL